MRNTLATDETAQVSLGVQPGSWRRLSYTIALVAALVTVGLGGELIALAVLLTLILLHEGGHYLAARACSMRVEQFFVGFGPVIWSYRRNGIEYGVKAVPLGGYVKIAGMTSEDAGVADGYQQSNALRRAVVVVAGPAVNLLVALVVGFVMLFSVGLPQAGTTVARVDPRLGAASAGIRPGDEIVGVNDVPIRSWAEVTDAVEATAPGRDVDITVLRDSRSYRYSVPVLRDAGVPRIGVQADTEHVRYGYVSSVRGSAEAISDVAVGSVRGVGSLIGGVGDLVGGVFGGEVDPAARPLSPIGAVQIGAEIGGRGVFDALQLVLLYSTFLAVFNLLPVPPLDGGRFVIVVIEAAASAVRRRRVEVPAAVSQRIGTAVAVFLLGIGMMALILDITQPVLQ